MDKMPIKLQNDLIYEAVFELRFSSLIPPGAVFGMVYQILAKNGNPLHSTPLPITQLPELVRNSDPNLRYAPHNTLTIGSFNINVGPHTIIFTVQRPYPGWSNWRTFIAPILHQLIDANIFNVVERASLRYVNFTEKNVFSILNASVVLIGKEIVDQPLSLQTEVREGEYSKVLQIANKGVLMVNNEQHIGSLIDIDIHKDLEMTNQTFKRVAESILDETRLKERELFFQILTKDFIATLGPIYEEAT